MCDSNGRVAEEDSDLRPCRVDLKRELQRFGEF